MLNSIKTKDRNYKVKKVIVVEDDVLVEANDQEEKELPSSRSIIRNKLIDLDSDDDDDEKDKNKSSSNKKKNSVRQYKEAINIIGSKSNIIGSTTSGKKGLDKVIVSETEYNLNDKWLINDIEKKSHQAQKHHKNSKRKFSFNSDLEEEDKDEEDLISTNETKKNSKSSSKVFDSDEEDFDVLLKSKRTSNNNKCEKSVKSPISKKRFVDANYEERQRESIELVKDAQKINLSEDLQFDFLNSDTYLNMDFESSKQQTSPKNKNNSPSKLKGR